MDEEEKSSGTEWCLFLFRISLALGKKSPILSDIFILYVRRALHAVRFYSDYIGWLNLKLEKMLIVCQVASALHRRGENLIGWESVRRKF